MNRPQRTRTMPSRFSEDFTLTNDLTSLETTQDDEVNDSAHLLKHQDADSELGSDHEMEQGSDEEVEGESHDTAACSVGAEYGGC